MEKTVKIANMKFAQISKIVNGECIDLIVIYSYDKQIACLEFNNFRMVSYIIDLNFYSMTTRKHQGIAKAICEKMFYNDFSSIYTWSLISMSKSLRNLIERFGYKSVRKAYGIDGNRK